MKTILLLTAIATLHSAHAVEILSSLKPAEAAALVTAEESLKTIATKHLEASNKETAANAKQIADLLALPRIEFGDRLALEGKWKVRSLQVNDLGAYAYPYFPCEFVREGPKGLRLEKNAGSQRRSGLIGDDGKGGIIFIGGKYYTDETPIGYSGFQEESVKTDPTRDSYGTLHRLGKGHLILIFGETREIYEFKKAD